MKGDESMKGFLAGFCIALGATVYLSVGGPLGALLFSIGLICVVTFGFDLFTGKAGLLATNEISVCRLGVIWFQNLFGVAVCALMLLLTPAYARLEASAAAITQTRMAQTFLENMIYGVFCGIFMYVAVTGYKKTGNYLFAMMPVMVFIVCGFNHCVADMFYVIMGGSDLKSLWSLIPTTIGNIIGTNFIPYLLRSGK